MNMEKTAAASTTMSIITIMNMERAAVVDTTMSITTIMSTYGGYGRHGGGAFSGKDPTKVDRSACYAARYAAKNIVAAGLAKKCEVQLAYAIGVARPLCENVNTFGTGVIPDEKIAQILHDSVDFRPAAIIDYFGLRKPIYKPLSSYGHFGREELGVRWESTDIADLLRDKAGLK